MSHQDEWRREALICRRIIKALPDCLTKTALQEIDMHLAVDLNDDAAANEYRELTWRPHNDAAPKADQPAHSGRPNSPERNE
jgi:hypothetical protein